MSPWRTTTAPEACLAILPVSNEISLPAISTETRVQRITTHIHCLPVPPVGRRSVFFFSFPNGRSLADGSGLAEGGDDALAQQLDARQLAGLGA